MEKKKEFKISLKTALIGIISIIIIIGIVLCRIVFNYDNITEYEGDYKKISYRSSMNDSRFTSIISQNGNSNTDQKYTIVSNQKEFNTVLEIIKNNIINAYNYYTDYEARHIIVPDNYTVDIKDFYNIYGIDESKFDINDYSSYGNVNWNAKSLLIIECCGQSSLKTTLMECKENEESVNVKIFWDSHGVTGDIGANIFFIPISKRISNANIEFQYKKYNDFGMAYKPIIYLYPEHEQETTVTLGYPYKLTTSYPKYTDKWKVLARPNGDLKELKTGKNLYSLYYESDNVVNFKVEKDGFCVKGTEIEPFLEDKLAKLGLTDRESEEFIIYWLPKLESNEYNYIRFATTDEIDTNMPLNINPKPDTLIRILMTYKGLNNPICVEEQEIKTQERAGFVAVEWGGTELK